MTYLSRESSSLDGEPIELYEWEFPSRTYRYTSSSTAYDALGNTWSPSALKRSNIKVQNLVGNKSITIQAPKKFPPALAFKDNLGSVVSVKIYRIHRTDSEAALQGVWYMKTAEEQDTYYQITAESISFILQNEYPRFYYQIECNHQLYSFECGVVPTVVDTTVTAVGKNIDYGAITKTDSRWITLTATVPIEAVLSYLTIKDETKLIMNVTGVGMNEVLVSSPFEYARVGDAASFADKGCNKTKDHCLNRFANFSNYGGMPTIPLKNIFGG